MKSLPPLALLAAATFAAPLASPAWADAPSKAPKAEAGPENPKPVVGKAPVDAPAADAAAKPTDAPTVVFDASEFGEVDKATKAIMKRVEEKCYAEPRSREGMSPGEEKVCNQVVAQLVKQGVKAVPGILAALDKENDYEHYYARTRLYYALGKMDDPRVEDVLIRGYARIASKRLDGYANDLFMIENALVTMNAADPVGAAQIDSPDVTDQWSSATDHVMTWRLWQRDHAAKSKADLRRSELARARTDAKSKDLKVAYLAMSTLAELAPNEALKLANKVLEDEGLSADKKSVFYSVTSRAYQNGAKEPDFEAPIPDSLPVKEPPPKKMKKPRARD